MFFSRSLRLGPYLHDGVEGRVCADTEVCAGHIVTNGSRQHAHRDAKLLVFGPGLVQLQQGLKGLMVAAVIRGLDHQGAHCISEITSVCPNVGELPVCFTGCFVVHSGSLGLYPRLPW